MLDNKSYELKVETIDKSVNNDKEIFKLHFYSYEESISLNFFKHNGTKEEFLSATNFIFKKHIKLYLKTIPKLIQASLRKKYLYLNKKQYKIFSNKTFSKNDIHKLKNNFLYTKYTISDENNIIKHYKKILRGESKISIDDIIPSCYLVDILVKEFAQFGFEEFKKTNIIYVDLWGSTCLQGEELKLLRF